MASAELRARLSVLTCCNCSARPLLVWRIRFSSTSTSGRLCCQPVLAAPRLPLFFALITAPALTTSGSLDSLSSSTSPAVVALNSSSKDLMDSCSSLLCHCVLSRWHLQCHSAWHITMIFLLWVIVGRGKSVLPSSPLLVLTWSSRLKLWVLTYHWFFELCPLTAFLLLFRYAFKAFCCVFDRPQGSR